MNERIEAYLKQHHCRDYFNTYGETIEDDHYFMYREEIDGLVELIVKECADYIRSNYDNWEAEPLAFNMETDFGLHGDYAE